MAESWKAYTSDDVIHWLLVEDTDNAPVRYFALRDLIGMPAGSADLVQSKAFMVEQGPINEILAKQHPDGHWDRADSIYYDKYTGTCWSIIMLAQMGANASDARVKVGCDYLLAQGVGEHGGFSMNGRRTGAVHCLQGNLASSLLDMGYENDPRVLRRLNGWRAA